MYYETILEVICFNPQVRQLDAQNTEPSFPIIIEGEPVKNIHLHGFRDPVGREVERGQTEE